VLVRLEDADERAEPLLLRAPAGRRICGVRAYDLIVGVGAWDGFGVRAYDVFGVRA